MTKRVAQIIVDWSIPLLLLAAATVYIRTTGVDVTFQERFYKDGVGWIGGVDGLCNFIKAYGPLPGLVIAIGSLVVVIASVWIKRFVRFRFVALFFVAVMAVGPGLIVNGVFKQNWGRPRPLDLQEFNRDSEFIEVWGAPSPGSGASFPSGHAASAFFLFTPYFIFRRRDWRWATFFLMLGLGYGALTGFARMAQGAHFLSDVVWSAGFVYLTGLAFTYLMRVDSRALVAEKPATEPHPGAVRFGRAVSPPSATPR